MRSTQHTGAHMAAEQAEVEADPQAESGLVDHVACWALHEDGLN